MFMYYLKSFLMLQQNLMMYYFIVCQGQEAAVTDKIITEIIDDRVIDYDDESDDDYDTLFSSVSLHYTMSNYLENNHKIEKPTPIERVDMVLKHLRYLEEKEKVDFLCCDVSFISVKLIIPSIYKILKRNGEGVILIKPQFEAGQKYLNKNGIVTDKNVHEKVVSDVLSCLKENNLEPINKTTSPIYYEDKNVEYLVYFKKD